MSKPKKTPIETTTQTRISKALLALIRAKAIKDGRKIRETMERVLRERFQSKGE